MKVIAVADWHPAPGTIIEWTPTPATVAAAASAPRHPVGPSFLQRDHISAVAAARAAGRTHRAYTCAAVTVGGPLDIDAMNSALTEFIRAHEGLRCTFRVDPTVPGDIARHVVPASAIVLKGRQASDASSDISAHLDLRLPDTAVFDAFPGVTFGAVARADSFDLYFAMDHAFGDGSSQILGLAEIISRYRNPVSGWLAAGAEGSAEHGSHVEHTAAEFGRAGALTVSSPAVENWRDALGRTGGSIPAFPLPLGIDDDPQPVAIQCEPLVDAARADVLSEHARTVGTSLAAVVYAGLALTEREVAGREVYSTATVLATRSAQHVLSQGWYCNFAPIAFPIDGTTLDDVLPSAAASLARAKELSADPVHGALGVLIGAGELDPSVVASPQMVTFIDFRWFPLQEELRDAVLFTGEGRTRNASVWITRDHDGLRINTQRPDNAVASASVTRYFATLRGILTQAADLAHTAAAATEVPVCT